MSMVNDIFGIGRTAYTESTDTIEPEIADMKLEDAEDLDEGTDLMEFMTGVAYECDMNMRNLEMAIVADEFNYLRENGQEMVYEEGRIQSVIDKFKASTKWLWEQIQKFYKSAINKINQVIKLDERFLKKYEAKASKGTGVFKGPVPGAIGTEVTNIIKNIGNMENESNKVADKYLNNANYTNIKDDDDKFVETNMETVFKNVFGNSGSDKSKAKDVFASTISKLKEDKSTKKLSGKVACEGLKNCKSLKADLKKAYDQSKKVINSHLKIAKKAESLAKKYKVLPTALSRNIHKVVKVLSTIGKWCVQANKCGVKCVNMMRSTYKAIIVSAASDGAVKNATSTGSGSGSSDDDDIERKMRNTSRATGESALDLFEPGMGII